MEEKMMILKMLEEGKVTPEQAAELLKAVSADSPAPDTRENAQSRPPQPDFGHFAPHTPRTPDTRHTHHTSHAPHSASDTPLPNSGGPRAPHSSESKGLGLDEIAADLRVRFGELAKEWEPKVKSFAGTMAEKTAEFADKVAKATEPKPGAGHPHGGGFAQEVRQTMGDPPAPARASGHNIERVFELTVTGASNELIIAGQGAPVTIKGYNGDKISAKVSCRPSRHDAGISLVSHGDKYILNYDETDFNSVAIDAYVPEKLFGIVRISTDNALLRVSGVSAESVSVSGTNAKIEVSDIYAKSGSIDSVNGAISAVNLDIENMKVETSNAPINLSITSFAKHREYTWLIETSNGRIFANIPSTFDLGYHVRAASALGSVKLGLTGLSYTLNSAANIEARSVNYDSCAKRVRVSFESSNADIIVN